MKEPARRPRLRDLRRFELGGAAAYRRPRGRRRRPRGHRRLRPTPGRTSPRRRTARRWKLYVNGARAATKAVTGPIAVVHRAAQDRRQRDLGRVLQRHDRRGPHLQPRRSRRPRSQSDMTRRSAARRRRAARHDRADGVGLGARGRRDGLGRGVNVTATATDNVGVSGVQFQLDGNDLGAEDTTAPYGVTWDTTAVANGTHTLTAVARDAAGNIDDVRDRQRDASQRGPDTTAPTVSVTAPAAGATVSGAAVAVSARRRPTTSASAGVQFRLDGTTNIGAADTSSPYARDVEHDGGRQRDAHHHRGGARRGRQLDDVRRRDGDGATTRRRRTRRRRRSRSPRPRPGRRSRRERRGHGERGRQRRRRRRAVQARRHDEPRRRGHVVALRRDVEHDGGLPTATHTLTAVARDAAGNSTTSRRCDGDGRQRAAAGHDVADRVGDRAGGRRDGLGRERRGVARTRPTTSASSACSSGSTARRPRRRGHDRRRTASLGHTTALTNGNHTLTAVARDAAGNSTTSAGVTRQRVQRAAPAARLRAGRGVRLRGGQRDRRARRVRARQQRHDHRRDRITAGRFGNALSFNGTNERRHGPRRRVARPHDRHDARGVGQPGRRSATGAPSCSRRTPATRSTRSTPHDAGRPRATSRPRRRARHARHDALAAQRRGRTSRPPTTGPSCGCTSTACRSRRSRVTEPIPSRPARCRIGGNAVWGEWFAGLIDEVRVYNRALSGPELQGDMTRAVG